MLKQLVRLVPVLALVAGMMVPGAALAEDAEIDLLQCLPNANTPWKSGSVVNGSGNGVGCFGQAVTVRLKWDRFGPDHVFATNGTSGNTTVNVSTACTWSGSRNIYVEAEAGGQIVQSARRSVSCG